MTRFPSDGIRRVTIVCPKMKINIDLEGPQALRDVLVLCGFPTASGVRRPTVTMIDDRHVRITYGTKEEFNVDVPSAA